MSANNWVICTVNSVHKTPDILDRHETEILANYHDIWKRYEKPAKHIMLSDFVKLLKQLDLLINI